MNAAVKFYKDVLHHDNMDIEAIACIGTFYFYTDQPEVALKFYRWGLGQGTVEPLEETTFQCGLKWEVVFY